jgi:hypothetical protein
MSRAAALAVAVVLGALAQAAPAQDRVYRCGADARSYSQQPCASGATIEVDDARNASQVAQAQQVARLDARLADTLTRQRLQAEYAAARQGPVLIGAAHASHDVAACHPGSPCARADRPKRKGERAAGGITLYRAPVAQ